MSEKYNSLSETDKQVMLKGLDAKPKNEKKSKQMRSSYVTQNSQTEGVLQNLESSPVFSKTQS